MEKKRFLGGCNNRLCVVNRLLYFFCLFIGIYACQVDEEGVTNRGTLAFRMNVDTVLVSPLTKASGWAGFRDANSYAVTIAQDSGVVATYARFDKMPAELELAAGAYTIQVSKGTDVAAAFDAPYFSGKKDFTIVKDMTTLVEVTAAMANSRVTIDYSDDFLATYKEYTLSLKTNKMELPLVYEKGESRPMYFRSDVSGTKLEIAMELVNVYGKTINYTATTTIKPKQWSKLTVRTDEKGLNGIAIDVTLNDETKETVYVNIGIPDFMEKLKGAPWISTTGTTVEWSDTNKDEEFEKIFSSFEDISNIPVSITAGGKINNLFLTVSENDVTKISYDLANLESKQKEELLALYSLALPDKIKGEVNVSFDLQGFLRSLFGIEDKSYVIELSATDALPTPNKTTKKVIATYKAMAAPSIPAKTYSFEEGNYNSSFESFMISNVYYKLKSFLFGEGDNMVDLMVNDIDNVSFTRSTEATPTSYSLRFEKDWFNSLTAGEHVFTLKAVDAFDREVTNTMTVTVTAPVFEWAMTENDGDVFAKYAYLRVKANDPSKVVFYANGNPLTNIESLGKDANGIASFVWKGLTPNQSYTVSAKYNSWMDLSPITFTTENAGSLPNAGFEDWYFTQPNGGKYWEVYYACTQTEGNPIWNTMNLLTTSEGGNSTLGTGDKRNGCRYNANSGTLKTADASEGSSAALIRTVGWGKGNTAAVFSGIMGTCKHLTPGELYLGDFNTSTLTPVYSGYNLDSRPYAISFAYKYIPKNASDWGLATIEIRDKAGNSLFKEEKKINSQSSYTKETIRLSYSQLTKADKIYIQFKSSANSNCWAINKDNLTPPPGSNLTTGEYVGSQLYIDDVELIYDYSE